MPIVTPSGRRPRPWTACQVAPVGIKRRNETSLVGRLSSPPPGSTAARSGARVKNFFDPTRCAALLRCQVREERRKGACTRSVKRETERGRGCAVREEPRPKLPAPSFPEASRSFLVRTAIASRFSRGEAHTDFVEPGMRCAPSTRGKACVRPGRSRNCGHGGRPRMLRSTRGTAAPESTSARGTCRRAPSRRRARRRLPVGSLVRSKDSPRRGATLRSNRQRRDVGENAAEGKAARPAHY